MNNAKHISGVHFFRGMAALLVVLHHAYRFIIVDYGESVLSRLFIGGASGVQFFFVLSGFIIYHIHSHDAPAIKEGIYYLKKRIIRIYPLYWLVLSAVFTLLLLSDQYMPNISRSFSSFFVDALLIYSPKGMIVPVAWTLCHEILFYFIFFVSYYLWNKLIITLLVWGSLSLVISFLLTIFNFGQDLDWVQYIQFFFNINHVFFVIGVAIAWLIKKKEYASSLNRLSRTCIVSGLFFYASLMAYQSYVGFDRDYNSLSFFMERVGFGIASAIILLGACWNHAGVWKSRLFVLLADASYSIYLIHMFVQIAFLKIIDFTGFVKMSNELIFLTLSVIGVVSGVVLHKLIEKPLLSIGRRMIKLYK